MQQWQDILETSLGNFRRQRGLFHVQWHGKPGGSWLRLPSNARVIRDTRSLLRLIHPDVDCCEPPERGARAPASGGRLNQPRGACWVQIDDAWSGSGEPDAVPELTWLPVYVGKAGIFALQPTIYYLRTGSRSAMEGLQKRLRDGSILRRSRVTQLGPRLLRFEYRAPEMLDMLDLERRLRESGLPGVQVAPHWVPVVSPAADVLPDWPKEQRRMWHIAVIGAGPTVLEPLTGADGERAIAMIDVDFLPHSDLAGYELVTATEGDQPTAATEKPAHGTCGAGILIADSTGKGPVGLAKDAKLLAIDVHDWNINSVCAAIWRAIEAGVRVISMSCEFYPWAEAGPNGSGLSLNEVDDLLIAVDAAHRADILVCAAAGNVRGLSAGNADFWGPQDYLLALPARSPHVLAVGAIAPQSPLANSPVSEFTPCWYSFAEGWGTRAGHVGWQGSDSGISVVAPGCGIYTTERNDEYNDFFNGTSAATPQVAALALRLMNKGLSAIEARRVIEATAQKTGLGGLPFGWRNASDPSTWNPVVGYGLVRFDRALNYADMSVTFMAMAQNTLSLSVGSVGTASGRGVSLRAWRITPGMAWVLSRDSAGVCTLAEEDHTPIPALEGHIFTAAGHTRGELQLPTSPALGSQDEILVIVDAENDHGFHAALAGETTLCSWWDLRGYNNILRLKGPPPQ